MLSDCYIQSQNVKFIHGVCKMLSKSNLIELMKKQRVYIEYRERDRWCEMFTNPVKMLNDETIIVINVFYENRYVPLYFLAEPKCHDINLVVSSDSPVYGSPTYLVPFVYESQVTNFVFWLSHKRAVANFKIFPYTYCHYCRRKLTSYASMLRGYGRECKPKED